MLEAILFSLFAAMMSGVLIVIYTIVFDSDNCKECARLFSWSKDAIITYDAASTPLERRSERHGTKAIDFCRYPKMWSYKCVQCQRENTTRGLFIRASDWQPIGDPYAVNECVVCHGKGQLEIPSIGKIICFSCEGRCFDKKIHH